MTGTQLAALIRYYTKTTSATLTDANLLPVVNNAKNIIATRITEKSENYFILPSLFDLVNSSLTAREYSLSDDQLNNIVGLDLAFDQTQSPLNYISAKYTSFNAARAATGGLTEGNIVNTYTNTFPHYFIQRRSLFLMTGSITGMTAGNNCGRLYYRVLPTDLANLTGITDLGTDPTTTSFGIPVVFHELWARLCSIMWKEQRPNPLPLSALELNFEVDLKSRLDEIETDDLSSEILGIMSNTSREGNFGQDL